jgi:alpha-L-rhamnosidase
MVGMLRCLASLLISLSALAADPANLAELRRGFEQPPDDARMMVRWWWFGPAVTKTELEREMRMMKAGGIGGFEVQATYPLQLEGNMKYLSPEFLDALKFTGEKAKELGLRMDLTLGSGWPYGGPHIPVELASGRLRTALGERSELPAGDTLITTIDGLNFIASHTRQTVKRPAVGAEGWVLDHYNRAALEAHFKAVGEPLLKALEKTPPYAIFSDSLEVYNADWTPAMFEEFQKRRGYDLRTHLAPLNGGTSDDDAAVRHDWGLTLSEMADDNYLKPLTAFAKAHGTRFRSQTYGIPPVTLSSNALVDLPEGEGHEWRRFSTTRWATSAGHIYGRPVISSETWTWLHSPVFRATPLDMKAEADIHFLQGINQLVGHGYPYSPPEAGEPGWRFYAAAVFNNHNPWWIVMPDITKYLQRVSWILRQGTPATDVAIYLPTHDAFAGFKVNGRQSVNQAMEGLIGPNIVPAILDAGYGFDFIDDGAIASKGINYKILVVPNVERIPLATYKKIAEFKGTVIFTKRLPSKAPGLQEKAEAAAIESISAKYKLTDESKIADALHAAAPPDWTLPPEIGVVHRKLPYADLYFVANTANHAVKFTPWSNAAWWDPSTGKDSDPHGVLAPYESRIVIRNANARPAASEAAERTVAEISGWEPWPQSYSGTRTYEKTISLPSPPAHAWLDFGDGTPIDPNTGRRPANGMRALLESPVREAAQVLVNDKPAGSVWKPPYRVDISGLLKSGENTIKIVVANTALNEMASKPLPDFKDLTAKFGERFQAQDMQDVKALPSGLTGPVKLVTR